MLPTEKTNTKDFIKTIDKVKHTKESVYKIEISFNKNNPIHIAFLMINLFEDTFNYDCIFSNSYEQIYSLKDVYYIKLIKQLT